MNRKQLSTYSIYAFYLISIINLIEQVINTGWLDLVTKPLLMIALLLYYLLAVRATPNSWSKLIVGALVFSWFGDVLLMLQGKYEDLFIFGLAAFLLAHICYILGFRKAKFDETGETNRSFVHTRLVFLVFVGGVLIYMLHPYLNEMLVPVISYTIVIIAMGIAALFRRGWTTDKSFIMVYSGALLFIMSDAMIGINKFMNPIIQASLLIMATYIAAQFLIIKGILVHEREMSDQDEIRKAE
jgi:uncharacterized membrane protein YhhN